MHLQRTVGRSLLFQHKDQSGRGAPPRSKDSARSAKCSTRHRGSQPGVCTLSCISRSGRSPIAAIGHERTLPGDALGFWSAKLGHVRLGGVSDDDIY